MKENVLLMREGSTDCVIKFSFAWGTSLMKKPSPESKVSFSPNSFEVKPQQVNKGQF